MRSWRKSLRIPVKKRDALLFSLSFSRHNMQQVKEKKQEKESLLNARRRRETAKANFRQNYFSLSWHVRLSTYIVLPSCTIRWKFSSLSLSFPHTPYHCGSKKKDPTNTSIAAPFLSFLHFFRSLQVAAAASPTAAAAAAAAARHIQKLEAVNACEV